MIAVAPGWKFDVDRGPDWLLVRIKGLDWDSSEPPSLADSLWELVQCHFTYRLVLEMHDVDLLNSYLIGQLVVLYKRIREHEGVMRLCGLSPCNVQVLRAVGLDDRFLPYRDREEAVMGCRRPAQPR